MGYNAATFSSDEDDFDLERCTNLAMKMHFMKTTRPLKSGRYLLAGRAIKMLLTLNTGGRTSKTGTQTSTPPHFLAMKMLLTLNAAQTWQ
jgi:hypothetical protein